MSELSVPLDYEQLPELWQLRRVLSDRDRMKPPALHARQIEAHANFIFHRLLVTLGYLAKSTNRPGLLNEMGAQQLRASLDPLFGEDCDPVELLTQPGAPLLMAGPQEGTWICQIFAKLNPHLSGDYKPGHVKGNINSRLSAAMTNIVGEAARQAMLLPDTYFQKQGGERMTPPECQQAIVLIRTLDRCLMQPARKDGEFSAGIMASAAGVMARHDKERLRVFYYWLANNYERPAIPKSSEEILKDFDQYFALQT